jgi:hypothetical protein
MIYFKQLVMHFKSSPAPIKVSDTQSTILEELDVHELTTSLTTPQLTSGNDGHRA